MAIDLRSIPGWSLVALLGLPVAGQTALMERSIDGVDLFYDSILDITWLGNANLAATETFGVEGVRAGGGMSWYTAMDWLDAMNDEKYLGLDGWRLPKTVQPDPTCSNQDSYGQGRFRGCTGSEMGHLSESGELGFFENVSSLYYWSGTDYEPKPSFAWRYHFPRGYQDSMDKGVPVYHAWAVIDGDVSPIPLPATGWLFLLGLTWLGGLAWRGREKTS